MIGKKIFAKAGEFELHDMTIFGTQRVLPEPPFN